MRQYAIIQSPNPSQLIGAVNKALKEGWELAGGLSMVNTIIGLVDQKMVILYAQAMTKDEPLVIPPGKVS